MIELTQTYLKSILDYNPETGEFIWKWRDDVRPNDNARCAGKIAGSLISDGSRGGKGRLVRVIGINGKVYRAARLAYLYTDGVLPEGEIDHIDTDPTNDRRLNLRPATSSQNSHNMNKHKDSKSSYKGVSFHKATGKWRAAITLNYKRIHLGMFSTPEEAARVYNEAALKYSGEFARLNPL